jgi:Arc/MetJ-type ribon-helix-helix transcriptional regulator
MKTLTVRLPEPLVADIEAESRGRKISKSDVVRERLEIGPRKRRRTASLNAIADLIGSVDNLPSDLTRPQETVFARHGLWPETSSLMLDL